MKLAVSNTGLLVLAIGLATVGQVPAGIYLPAVIEMSRYFQVSYGEIQYVVAIYLFCYGLSQLVYGPLSDHFGRRFTVFLGLIIFFVGSVMSLLSSNVVFLYLGSVIQGSGLGSVTVVSTAILRDLFHDKRLLNYASYKSAAMIITPLAAPIVGSYLLLVFGWRSTFAFQLLYAIVVFVLTYHYLTETRIKQANSCFSMRSILGDYKKVIVSNNFLQFGLCRVLIISGGTAYAVSAPFLYQGILKLTPVQYAWIIILPASGFFIGSLLSKRLGGSMMIEKVVKSGVYLGFFSCLLFLAWNGMMPTSLLSIMLPMFIYKIASGIVFPSAIVGAILPLGALAGTATALVGSVQNLGRGFFSTVVGLFYSGNVIPLALTMTGLSLLAVIVSLRFFKTVEE